MAAVGIRIRTLRRPKAEAQTRPKAEVLKCSSSYSPRSGGGVNKRLKYDPFLMHARMRYVGGNVIKNNHLFEHNCDLLFRYFSRLFRGFEYDAFVVP